MRTFLLSCFLCLSLFPVLASVPDSSQTDIELTEEQMMALYEAYTDSVINTLTYDTGTITLRNSLATINVPAGFKFLNGKDSEMVLTDLWGNPPSPEGYESLGMLFLENDDPMTDSSFVINITYSEDGYIDDSDAKDIDYDDLLETMQEDTKAGNEYREMEGYPSINLVGWAAQPFYDAADKKLHWAKELKFGDAEDHTLNYNIRILGRKGYLELNAIGEMYVLDKVDGQIDNILPSVNFNDGNRYSDFDPGLDKVAAYGIGGLIAGKVLAKAGILAKIGIVLAKFWKFILLGLVALGAFFRKLFGGGEESNETA